MLPNWYLFDFLTPNVRSQLVILFGFSKIVCIGTQKIRTFEFFVTVLSRKCVKVAYLSFKNIFTKITNMVTLITIE